MDTVGLHRLDAPCFCHPGALHCPDAARAAAAPSEPTPGLRERIETNLRVAQRRIDAGTATDFDRGKASAFRVVLSMLDGLEANRATETGS